MIVWSDVQKMSFNFITFKLFVAVVSSTLLLQTNGEIQQQLYRKIYKGKYK